MNISETPTLQPIVKMNRDGIKALGRDFPNGVTQSEARFLVDTFYCVQRSRISNTLRCKGLDRSAKKAGTEAEPHEALDRFAQDFQIHEDNVAKILGWYVESHPMAWFFDATLGVGPVTAAGLLAYIDITLCPTVGHIYSFAGLDPSRVWNKGEKRPWNTQLKTICWKIGDSFVKLSKRADCYYGQYYSARKAEYWKRNLNGDYREQALASLEAKKYGKSTDQWYWYSGAVNPDVIRDQLAEDGMTSFAKALAGEDETGVPMLSPGHIDARARRATVKLFLSHLHECWRREMNLPLVAPFAIAIKGHAHYLPPPQIAWRESVSQRSD